MHGNLSVLAGLGPLISNLARSGTDGVINIRLSVIIDASGQTIDTDKRHRTPRCGTVSRLPMSDLEETDSPAGAVD